MKITGSDGKIRDSRKLRRIMRKMLKNSDVRVALTNMPAFDRVVRKDVGGCKIY